jgi:hypothetical protein
MTRAAATASAGSPKVKKALVPRQLAGAARAAAGDFDPVDRKAL